MNDYIFTGLAPNTQKDDIALAGRLLLKPWSWISGRSAADLERRFENSLPIKHAVAFASGRGALRAILSSLGLKSDDQVLLQAYTCVSVPGAILAAGLKPVYVDIEPDTLNMSAESLEKNLTSRSRAVIIQHTFGAPADMENLTRIARKHNLFVIEDCAHALGGKLGGKSLGTFGDAAIFSFGRDKVVSSVFGGVAAASDKNLAEKISQFRESKGQAGNAWIFQQLLHPIVTRIVKLTYSSGFGPVLLRFALASGLISKAVNKCEKAGGWTDFADKAMPEALAKMALHQLEKLEPFNKHRLMLAEIYRAKSRRFNIERQKNRADGEAPLMRYTLFVNHGEKLREAMKKDKIFLGDWYSEALAPRDADYQSFGYRPGDCPVAEARAKMSVNLPLQTGITKAQAEKIIAGVIKVLHGN